MTPRRVRETVVAIALYAVLVFLSFLPQSLRPRDTIAYVGDSLESVYIVAWNVHQFFRSPAHLFDANVLYPHARALAFTDHRLLPSLAVAPVQWATGDPVLATNVAVGLVCLLAAMGGRRLAMVLGLPPVAAWAELVLYLETGQGRRAWRTAGFMLLQGLSSNYHLLYGALVIALVVLGALALRPRVVAPRLPVLAAAALAAALLFAPMAAPYLRTAREQGYVRELGPGIGLEHYLSTSPTNLFYGAIGTEVRLQQRGPHFVGFLSLGLALLALAEWALRRPRHGEEGGVPPSTWVPAAGALALVLVLLSLGPDVTAWGHRLGPGPYRLLYRWVPGFQLVRIPERLGLLAMLFVGLLAGRGLCLLETRGARVGAVLLAALIPLEHVGPLPVSERVPVGSRVPEYVRWLAANPAHAIAEVPIHGEGLVREETEEMYFSAYHFKPIIHGYTAYPPLLSRLLRRVAAEFPSETALQTLTRLGIDTVVVHHGRPVGGDLARRLRDTGQPSPEAFRRLLRLADLDLESRLPGRGARARALPTRPAAARSGLALPHQDRRSRSRRGWRPLDLVAGAAFPARRRVLRDHVRPSGARGRRRPAPAARQRLPDPLPRRRTRPARRLDRAGAPGRGARPAARGPPP